MTENPVLGMASGVHGMFGCVYTRCLVSEEDRRRPHDCLRPVHGERAVRGESERHFVPEPCSDHPAPQRFCSALSSNRLTVLLCSTAFHTACAPELATECLRQCANTGLATKQREVPAKNSGLNFKRGLPSGATSSPSIHCRVSPCFTASAVAQITV